jgi:hypothetical protein
VDVPGCFKYSNNNVKKDKRQPDKAGGIYENIQLADEEYDRDAEEQIKLFASGCFKPDGVEKSIILLFLKIKNMKRLQK